MKMQKFKKFICIFLSALLVLTAFTACGQNEVPENSIYIYYSNSTADSIIYRSYVMKDTDSDLYSKVTELFEEMFTADYSDNSYYSSKPENVEIVSYSISESGVLSINFNDEYLSMTNVQEIILRSSTVLTVIQLEGITAVEFLVNGESVTNSEGLPIGQMTAEDFVNVLLNEEAMLVQEADVVLMFANADGTALVPVTSHFEISNQSMSLAEYVVTQLIEGPDEGSDVMPTISPNVELLSVTTSNYVCYVSFSQSFLEQEQPVSDTLLIYSIVNSLCRLSSVRSVQFLIEGEPATTLHQVTDISGTFTRDRSLEQTLTSNQTSN